MLNLTASQVDLLLAMSNTPALAIVGKRDIVWIDRRQYLLRDLYALRTARLVQPTEITLAARGQRLWELTDAGIGVAATYAGMAHHAAPEGPAEMIHER